MVNEVIPGFDVSDHARLKAEAQKWRLPYYDWATKKMCTGSDGKEEKKYDAPLIIQHATVDVYADSTGRKAPIDNPMYQYTTPKAVAMGEFGVTKVQYNRKDDIPAKVR